MAELLYRLGVRAATHAKTVLVAWLAALLVAGGAFVAWSGELTSSFDVPGLASSDVVADLEKALPAFAGASGTIAYRTQDGSALTDAQREQITAVAAEATNLPDVAGVVDPFAAEAQRAAGAQQIEEGRAQLAAGRTELETAQAQLDAAADAGMLPAEEVEAAQAKLDAGAAELDANEAALEAGAELLDLSSSTRVVSEDGSAALVNISFDDPRMELDEASKQAVVDHFTGSPVDGVEVAVSSDISQAVPSLVGPGEVAGLVAAAVVLVVMLGTVLGAGIPIVTALTGVAIGAVGTLAFSGAVQMASVTPVLGLMLGLAVGIDYALFILNRHRRQLLHGADLHESIGLANGTSGTAVVFAGTTVIVALVALNVTGIPFLGLMGTVGAVCVAIAVLVAITLAPALLGLAGQRIVSRRARAATTGQDDAVAHATPMSTGRAVVTSIVCVVGLLLLAIPALSMRVGLPDGSAEPAGSDGERAYAITAEAFGAGSNGRLVVVADLPAGLDEAGQTGAQLAVARQLSGLESVAAVAPAAVSADGRLAVLQVVPTEGPNAESTEELVHALRALPPVELPGDAGTATLGVTGQAAINIDISASLDAALPLYLLVVVGLSLVILVLVFRSILVPLIATGGFVLSLLATYGAITAVFQEGFGASLIGLDSTGPILSFLPVILVGILFGLAMDYQLFLATGMREAYVHGAPARLAVARGFRAGRSVVIAAGLIMVSVFGGFVLAESAMIRSVGFGLAFGVLVDAFVVRLLLVPALMHLLGDAAWWLPRWLDKVLPQVDVEGAALEVRHAHAPASDDAGDAPQDASRVG